MKQKNLKKIMLACFYFKFFTFKQLNIQIEYTQQSM